MYRLLPEVKAPEVQPTLKKKLMWTAVVLVLFYVMGRVQLIGLDQQNVGNLQQLQLILASEIGSLITVGIGPIVLASIILQLLVGGKIIDIDLSDTKNRAKFSSLQKLFAIALSFFEAAAYLGFGVFQGFLVAQPGMFLFVVLQIAFGSIILLYLDEVVSKYGIGSGIGLFIAAGVAGHVLWRIFAPPITTPDGSPISGILAVSMQAIQQGQFNQLPALLIPVLFALLIFFVVVFAEGIHVNIPITMGQSGMGGRFPVKFLYVSNLPVILAVALFANIQIWSVLMGGTPYIGGAIRGMAWATSAPTLSGTSFIQGLFLQPGLNTILFELGHAFVFIAIFVAIAVVFGHFWIDMAGQGPEAVSAQLNKSGMFIPGFRRDPRIIRGVLDRYIPPITILGSAFVALLAGLADLTGALGSGTGILLTVGIVYRMYEDLAKQQILETNPLLKSLVGA